MIELIEKPNHFNQDIKNLTDRTIISLGFDEIRRNLAIFASKRNKMMNASMELHQELLTPTYTLTTETIGRSYALIIANIIKMPERLTTQAKRFLGKDHQKTEQLLLILQKNEKILSKKLKKLKCLEGKQKQLKNLLKNNLKVYQIMKIFSDMRLKK